MSIGVGLKRQAKISTVTSFLDQIAPFYKGKLFYSFSIKLDVKRIFLASWVYTWVTLVSARGFKASGKFCLCCGTMWLLNGTIWSIRFRVELRWWIFYICSISRSTWKPVVSIQVDRFDASLFDTTSSDEITSLRKHPFLLALRCWGRFARRARRNGCFRRLWNHTRISITSLSVCA